MKNARVFPILMLVSSLVPAFAADEKKFGFELEFSPVWQTRNDTRIPNATGTGFAQRDIQGSGPLRAGELVSTMHSSQSMSSVSWRLR